MEPWIDPGIDGLDLSSFDRDETLYDDEREALWQWILKRRRMTGIKEEVPRLFAPFGAVREHLPVGRAAPRRAWKRVFYELYEENCSVWGLKSSTWDGLLSDGDRPAAEGRPYMFAYAYALNGYNYSPMLSRKVPASRTARIVFGAKAYEENYVAIEEALISLGYNVPSLKQDLPTMIGTLMLASRSSDPKDYSEDVLRDLEAAGYEDSVKHSCGKVSRALSLLGHLPEPIRMRHYKRFQDRDTRGIASEWVAVAHRWRETSTINAQTRQSAHGAILKFGKWLAEVHPEIRRPADWTPEIAAEAVALICNMRTGDWALASAPPLPAHRSGKPLAINTQCTYLMDLRRFFFDVEAWGWEKLQFNPHYHLATPTKILRQRGPNPRVIDDKVWLKLVWASLNLTLEDAERRGHYPFALVKAIGIVWTHAALRSNEIRRLRLRCSVPQEETIEAEDGNPVPGGTLTYLTVPPSKTAREFTKPLGMVVHEAIEDWLAVRPDQPALLDKKTGERVDFLFVYRGRQVGSSVIDYTVIPLLCEKAGVPRSDSRGKITSHRARASTVTALANAPQGLSLPELMRWVGHACSRSTMHYLAIKPTRLAATFAKADRTAHMMEVLVDHDAVVSGDAARGLPYQFYDLGDSYCTNPYWSTCPHRMACARCDFNLPKASAAAQALEARDSVHRLLEEVPLTDDERAAAEGDQAAINDLIGKLSDQETLDGRTREEIVSGNEARERVP